MDEVQTLRRIVTATDLETAKSMAEATLGQAALTHPRSVVETVSRDRWFRVSIYLLTPDV